MSIEREERPWQAPDDDAVLQALDAAAELERVIVAESSAKSPSAAELRAVEAALEHAWSPRARGSGLRIGLVAAGLLLVAFLAWRVVPRDAGGRLPDVTLGGQLQVVAPQGPVDAFRVLRWRSTSRGSPRFEVRVVDAATGVVLLHESDLQALELSLDNRDTSAWQRIRVEIDELDSNRQPLDSARAEAWRRSP